MVDAAALNYAVLVELEPKGDGPVTILGALFRPGASRAVDEIL